MVKILFYLFLFLAPQAAVVAQDTLPPYPYEQELQEEEAAGDSRFLSEFLYMLMILSLMIGVLLGGTWLIKRMVHGKMERTSLSSDIHLLDRCQVTARTAVYVLQVRGREIAIAESTNGVTYLGHAEKTQVPKSFEKVLKD